MQRRAGSSDQWYAEDLLDTKIKSSGAHQRMRRLNTANMNSLFRKSPRIIENLPNLNKLHSITPKTSFEMNLVPNNSHLKKSKTYFSPGTAPTQTKTALGTIESTRGLVLGKEQLRNLTPFSYQDDVIKSPQYKSKKQTPGKHKPASVSLKDKVAINHFLFGPEFNKGSFSPKTIKQKSNKVTLSGSLFQMAPNFPGSTCTTNRNSELTTQISARNFSPFETGLSFKSKLQSESTRDSLQTLRQIRESRSLKRAYSPSSSLPPSRDSVLYNPKHVEPRPIDVCSNKRNVHEGFRINRTIVVANRLTFYEQSQDQRNFEREMYAAMNKVIKENIKNVLICALEDEPEHNELKYWFIPREENANKTMKTSRTIKDDIEFKAQIYDLQRKIHLDSSYRYIHLLNGLPIFTFSQIPNTEKVVIIGRNNKLGDISKISNNELVTRFINNSNRKNHSMHDQERVEEFYKEVLQVVDHPDQLNSEELEQLVGLSNKGLTKAFSQAMQIAFADNEQLDEKNGESNLKGGIDQAKQKAKEEEDKNYVAKGGNIENIQGLLEGDSLAMKKEKYLNTTKPLKESQKLSSYKEILKLYDKGLSNYKQKYDTSEILSDDANFSRDQKIKSEAVRLQLDEKLEGLLNKWSGKKSGKITSENDKLELFYERSQNTIESNPRESVKKETQTFYSSEKKVETQEKPNCETSSEEKTASKDFVNEYVKSLSTKKSVMRKLEEENRELVLKNIPKYLKTYNLSRQEIHSIYVVYKALCEVTAHRYENYDIKNGIDFYTFRTGIFNVAVQSEELAEKLFYAIDTKFSGFLDWEQFLEVMVTIRAKTLHDKIDLFIKIADEDGNGNLSEEEISNLTKICLKKFIKESTDGFLDDLCEYFTRLIFNVVGYDITDEIPLGALKEAIFSGTEESNLLAMFCGADL